MTNLRPLTALLLAVPLAGCGRSPGTRTLTLDAVAPAPATVRADYRGLPILVASVHVPAALDRVEYVSQPSAGELRIDDFAHWGAPLGLLARDALLRDLISRLPAGEVLPAGLASAEGVSRMLDVTIVAINITPAEGTLQVAYRLEPDDQPKQLTLHTVGGSTPVESSQALGKLIGLLADRIVTEIS